MFAVIKTGGKQYRVQPDDVIRIERLAGEAGDTVSFDEVLMVGGEGDVKVGAPLVDGVTVSGTVVEQARGPKIIVFKKKRRQNYRRTRGHRQDLTVVRITDIGGAGGKKTTKKAAAKKPAAKTKADDGAADAPAKAEAAPKEAAPKKAKADTAAKKPKAEAAAKPAKKKADTAKPETKSEE